MKQTTIFDLLYEDYKITKPIRLIELFAGVGSQAMALRNIKIDFEHYKIAEWEVSAFESYKAIHSDDMTNYSADLSKEDITDILFKMGISNNGKEPMTFEQIKRKGEKWLRNTFNNIKATNNLVSVTNFHGNDLEIVETDKYEYIMTYSFPCQDLSVAGKMRGMEKGSGTRSGLLWEVERLLKEMDELPQILLMENVPQVISSDNIKSFNQWQDFLVSKGYSNYTEVLNAKDYGIPQNRERCFMVSILGEYNYKFPQKQELKLKLKDILENEVDEKYYLSAEKVDLFLKQSNVNLNWKGINENFCMNDICNTLKTDNGEGLRTVGQKVLIPQATKQGYIECNIPGVADLSFPDSKTRRGRVQENGEICPTLTAGNQCLCYIEPKVKSFGNFSEKKTQSRTVYDSNGISPTLCAGMDHGNTMPYIIDLNSFRIRKLIPLEIWRLTGFTDEDFEKAEKVNSNSMLYKQAGNSIVVKVLEEIFKQLT